jgi:transcriptional regulator with XRE-family HTH domain
MQTGEAERDTGFAGRLRQARRDAGLTQAYLAESAGVSLRTVQYLEGGRSSPYADTARRLADALKLTGASRVTFETGGRRRSRTQPYNEATTARALSSSEPLAATTASFVGRQSELGTLATRFRAAQQGSGSLVLVAGEPGIGKTRLAEELSNGARQQDGQVLWGRCWEAQGAPAFWP